MDMSEFNRKTRYVKVVGFKLAPWKMEGKEGISAEIYREVPLDGSKNGSDRALKGFCTESLRVPVDLLKRIAHLQPPFILQLVEEEVTNGKQARDVVVDLKPIEHRAQTTPAKAA